MASFDDLRRIGGALADEYEDVEIDLDGIRSSSGWFAYKSMSFTASGGGGSGESGDARLMRPAIERPIMESTE